MKRMVEQTADTPEHWHRDIYEDPACSLNECIKDHDFGLTSQPPKDVPILFAWREDWMAGLQSWFDLGVKQGHWPDDRASWRQFAVHKTYWYRSFLRKWGPKADIVQTYEERCRHPQAMLSQVLEHLGYRQMRSIEEEPMPHRDVALHRWYDEGLDRALREVHAAM